MMKILLIQLFVFIILIIQVILMGITTTVTSFCEFYHFQKPKIVDVLNFNNPLHLVFTTYTGLDTGYGFFAPNVSSNFIILSTNKHSGEMYNSSDLLKTTEGKLRFLGANDIFLKNLDKDTTKIKVNHLVLKQINLYFEKKFQSDFESSVLLYDFPSLYRSDENGKERLIKIDSIE